jgi:hypothetical protein
MKSALVQLLALLFVFSGAHCFSVSPLKREKHQLVCSSTIDNNQDPPITDEQESQPSASGRRQFLLQAAGALTIAPFVLSANADPSIISSLQGPVQDVIAPGHWIGQFIGINSKTVQWQFPSSSPAEVSKALVDVLNELTPERKEKLYIPNFDITQADASKVHVRTWTKNEWLDSLDLSLREENNGCVAKASFYATGFLPTSIPGALLVNIGMAWFPFASPGPRGEMLQDFRLRALEGLVTQKLQQQSMPRMSGL